MADWFAKLMQRGHAPERPPIVRPEAPGDAAGARRVDVRDARYASVVQRLRDREVEERDAREKRSRWYRQSLETDSGTVSAEDSSSSITRLYKLRTKVPCRLTPAAELLLDQLRKRYAGCTVSFSQLPNRRQAVMLTGRAGAMRRQIGWVEHCVQADPELCNVRDQGLSVETDDGSMLVLRFKYPSTSVRMCGESRSPDEPRERSRESREASELDLASGGSGDLKHQDFAEIRSALDLRRSEKESSPRLVWVTRPEAETMNALQSREYDAFYLRFKLEVQAGIWSSLLDLLSTLPGSQWKQGSCYTVVRAPDAATRKIHQRTVDDRGHRVDIGQDRTYDAAPATDILLLHLEGDILADFADIYFTLQSLSSSDAYFLKEEFFTVIRRFWTSAQSLASRYGGDLPALMRMAQRAVPMPAQSPMLKQDWTSLRQYLIDRYGEGGRKAADLLGRGIHRPDPGRAGWPFSSFPAGEVNVGLRVIYRQAWRHVGAQRGEVIRTVPLGAQSGEMDDGRVTSPVATCASVDFSRVVQTAIEKGESPRDLEQIVDDLTKATVDLTKWPVDLDGTVHIGLHDLAVVSDLEAECRESSRDISLRLTEFARNLSSGIDDRTSTRATSSVPEGDSPSSLASATNVGDQVTAARVYSTMRNVYEVLTRPVEIQNVVMVAEKLPAPAEINRSWVTRHDWIIARALLDESFRDALETIGVENDAQPERSPREVELEAKRERLYDHVRAHILHYQGAIWRQEDPQSRSMRYRKSGKKMPLDWQFEVESGSELTIDELGDRLAATSVDGHFAAYSGGREADLDRLIDPAGLLGYHGNYAVFRMRPEFGAEELFSMLHFFKSPYLGRDPETGESVVDDPEKLRRCGAAGPNDAEMLFRRERALTISVKTDGMVIDLVRSTPSAADVEIEEDFELSEEPVRYELFLDRAPGVGLLRSNTQPDSEGELTIDMEGEDREERLFTGTARSVRANEAEPVIPCRGRADRYFAGSEGDSRSVRGIAVNSDAAPGQRLVTGVGIQTDERVFHSSADQGRSIGRPHDSKAEPGIVTRSDRDSILSPAAHKEPVGGESVALSLGNEGAPATTRRVGRARAVGEPLIREPDSGGLILSSITGGGAARAHERVILAAGDAQSTPGLVAGAGASNEYEHMVLAHDDEWLRPSLVVG